MSSQVVRPIIPYRGPIPGGLHDGKLIEVKGTVPYGADSFAINLLTGLDPLSDRALHLSVRFSGRVVVRNHLERNAWGPEERAGIFPFHSGREFTLMIKVDYTSYHIAVNNQHCWEFVHRIPTTRVSSIFIEGSVQIERIEFIDTMNPYQPGTCVLPPTTVYPARGIDPGFNLPYQPGTCGIPRTVYPAKRTVYPARRVSPGGFVLPYQPGTCGIPPTVYPAGRVSPGGCIIPGRNITPGMPTTPAIPTSYPGIGTCIIPPPEQICPQPGYIAPGGSNLAPVYNPSIPYAYPIYGGLQPGMMVYISGRPSASAYRFTINFQDGTSPYPPPDIAFHFDARLFSRSIVRNCRTNNVWEREESIISHFPFQQGVNFDMMIRVDSDRYMVALNGQHFMEFRHRLHPLSRFDTLYIENDVVVSSIRFA